MKAKSLKSGQILRAHLPYFRRPGHIYSTGPSTDPYGSCEVTCISCSINNQEDTNLLQVAKNSLNHTFEKCSNSFGNAKFQST